MTDHRDPGGFAPPAPPPPAALTALGDPDRLDPGWRSVSEVADWLLRAPETERLARAVEVRARQGDAHRFLYWQALGLARLGTAGTVEDALAAVAEFGPPGDPELSARVLAARPVPWVPEFAARWLERAPHDARSTIDELVRLGVVPRPTSRAYAAAMIAGVPEPLTAARIRGRLLANPATVEADVQTMLTSPGAGARLYRLDRVSTSPARRLGADTWTVQIAALVSEGVLDRAAIVELCLATLEDDVDRPTALWFAGFYEHLKPTAEDAEPHLLRLRRMLGSHRSRVVALAQRSLLLLAREERINGRDVVEASAGPLARPEKRLVLGQLRLLGELVRTGPGFAPAAVRVAATALGHHRVDVQLETMRFLTTHGDRATLAQLDLTSLSPVLRAAMGGRLPGPARERPPSVERCAQRVRDLPVAVRRRYGLDLALAAVQAGRFPHVPPTPSGPGRPVPPPVADDPVELARHLARAMEADVDPVIVQRLIAAAVRTAAVPLAHRAAAWAPYREAADRVRAAVPFQHRPHARRLVAELAGCWADGGELVDRWHDPSSPHQPLRSGSGRPTPRRLGEVLPVLVVEAARLMSRRPGTQLVSEPTDAGGTVDPGVLLTRLAGVDELHPHVDLELAALRLPRGLGSEYWEDAAARNRFAGGWLHTYYRGQVEPPLRALVGTPVFRMGTRLGDGPRRAALAAARPGTRAPGVWWAVSDLDGIFEFRPHRFGPERDPAADATIAFWPSFAPWHPELIAAHLLLPLTTAQQRGAPAVPAAAAALDAPTGELGPIGHLALVQALQAARAPTRLAAAGTWRAAALDGRLDPGRAVAALVLLQDGGLLRLARVVAALRPAVDEPVVGYRTLQVLTAAAGPLFEARTPQLHLLLGLAEQLAARFGIDPALEEVRRAADPRKNLARHRAALPAVGPELELAALAALAAALDRVEATEVELPGVDWVGAGAAG